MTKICVIKNIGHHACLREKEHLFHYREYCVITLSFHLNLLKHLGSTFSLHFPLLQVRTSLPTRLNPSWQIYLALDSPMFIAILAFIGGFLSSLRSRWLHRLSFPKTKCEFFNFIHFVCHGIVFFIRKLFSRFRHLSHISFGKLFTRFTVSGPFLVHHSSKYVD